MSSEVLFLAGVELTELVRLVLLSLLIDSGERRMTPGRSSTLSCQLYMCSIKVALSLDWNYFPNHPVEVTLQKW